MAAFTASQAADAYRQSSLESTVASASPHRLIQLLMEGFLVRLERAKTAVGERDAATKGEYLSKCIDILGELRACLNHDVASELPTQLDTLYAYMTDLLVQANVKWDLEALDEAKTLMTQVKSGWDDIDPEATTEQR